jgi:AP-3 complex subunit mu
VPRPNLIYLPNTSPPTLVFSLCHANLLFLLTTSSELEPLLALEFLHRVIDVLEEFVGSPLLASKVESSYDVVAQLLNEMCDAGAVSSTEPNALRDLVEVEGWIGKLLGGINIPGYAIAFCITTLVVLILPGNLASHLLTRTCREYPLQDFQLTRLLFPGEEQMFGIRLMNYMLT